MHPKYEFVNVNHKFAPPIFPYTKKEDLFKWAKWRTPLDGCLPQYPDMNEYEKWLPLIEDTKNEIPKYAGVYILGIRYLLDEPVFPVYIGKTGDIWYRIKGYRGYITGTAKWSGRYDSKEPTNLVSLLTTITESYYWYATWVKCDEKEIADLEKKIIVELKDFVINQNSDKKYHSRAPKKIRPTMTARERSNKLTSQYISDYLDLKDQDTVKPMLAYYYENQIDFD